MVKNVLVIVLFVALHVKGQNYIPLPMDSAWWQVTSSGGWSSGGQCYGSYTFQYQTGKDSVIGAYTYKQILHNGPYSCLCGYGTNKSGFIRQDTSARKVYVIESGTSTELLLYDFTLQVGDTVNSALIQWSYPCGSPTTVSAIDSILISGVYHRRWNLNSCYVPLGAQSFIEGIGSAAGLLEYYYSFEAGSSLDCVGHKGSTIYPSQTATCTAMGVKENPDAISFKVLPNPAADFLTLETANAIDEIKIVTTLGQEMIFLNYSDRKNFSHFSVDVSALRAGIYFLQVKSGTQSSTQKFIVNH